MLRGSQQRGRQQQRPLGRQQGTAAAIPTQTGQQGSIVIDASHAKQHIRCDIDRVEGEIEMVKSNIGSTRKDIQLVENRIKAMEKYIEQLEQANPFFEQLSELKEPSEVIQCLDRNRALIRKLPSDQRETLDLLEGRMKAQTTPMEVDK